MPRPLHQAKAEFFRMLGHPVRIRVLELLQDGPKPVRELLADIEIEPSSLSQQLAVLRRSGIVTSTREGSVVVYALAGPDVGDLLRAARRILTEMLAGQEVLLAELRSEEAGEAPIEAGSAVGAPAGGARAEGRREL
ncbi:ArsR family transcriptional regulator [Nocardiopsis composta]|uniref:ArsR family transcriptional regulator n=1 Tax=Nocardiopsis composta TaxID=157465 RepID=A0A7W8QS19_9ACTN|nr:ArsR family transcriptional regulator [Nocardiopsis composta]